MLISENHFKDIIRRAGRKSEREAKKILENDIVIIEKFQIGWDYEYIYVYARIEKKIGFKKINVNFTINLETKEIEIYHCQCNYYSSVICEHTLACIMKFCMDDTYEQQILKTVEEKKIQDEMQKFQNFMNNICEEKYTQNQENEETEYYELNGTIKIIPELKYDGYPLGLKLSFKIGERQLYKIKDLTRFYNAYINKENLYYGSKLCFVHNDEAFSEKAKPFLNFILKYSETIDYTNNMLKNSRHYYSGTQISKTNIELSGSAADDFFSIFNDEQEYAIEYNKEKTSFKLTTRKPDLKFKINKEKDNKYKLTANFSKILIVKGIRNIYILNNNCIYKLNRYEYSNFIKILEAYNNSDVDEYKFDKKQLLEFVNRILPTIKEYVDVEEMPEEEIEMYIPKKLVVKILLDIDSEDSIVLNLKFCYDATEFNPLDENNIPAIPRDYYNEDEVLKRIRQDGFYKFKGDNVFVLHDEERIYNFLSNSINEYMEKFEVLVTEMFKKNEIKHPKISSIGVRIQNDLLNIDLSSFEFDKEELKEILNKYKLKKKYYRLKNGNFLDLTNNSDIEFLNDLTEGLAIDAKSLENGRIKIPINRSLYLNKLLSTLDSVNIDEDDNYKKIISETTKIENIKIPEEQKEILRPYQQTGYKWMKVLDKYKFGGILADDMGLGKTIQVITLLQSELNNSSHKPSIVVCPSSLSLNWKNEVEKFGKDINTLVITGSANQRMELIDEINKYDLIITSYDLLKRDIDV
jgi:hypothetical protein